MSSRYRSRSRSRSRDRGSGRERSHHQSRRSRSRSAEHHRYRRSSSPRRHERSDRHSSQHATRERQPTGSQQSATRSEADTKDTARAEHRRMVEQLDEACPPIEINAAMLAERQAEVYNLRRLNDFLECFSSEVCVEMLATGKLIYPNYTAFRERYACVFAKSDGKHIQAAGRGALKCEVTKRVYLEAPPLSSTFCIDFMRIDNLVRPLPPAFDGSAGTAFMATASLIVLYRARGNKIVHMWVTEDKQGVGADAKASEEMVLSNEVVVQMMTLAERVATEEAGSAVQLNRFYNQYHKLDTWM